MRVSRRALLAGAGALAGGALLGACSAEEDAPKAGASSVAPESLSGEISVLNPSFASDAQKKVWAAIIAKFNAKYANVKVNTDFTDYGKLNEKLTTALAGNLVPDVIMTGVGWIPPFAAKGVYAQFDESVIAGRGYTERVLETCRYQGKLYAIPWTQDTRSMIGNKELWDKAGISAPPKTFAELREAAKELTGGTGSNKQWGFIINSSGSARQILATFLGANNGTMFSPDGKTPLFTSPECTEALQLLVDIIKDGSSAWSLKPAEGSPHPFLGGKIGISLCPSSAWPTWSEANPTLLKPENSTLFRAQNKRMSTFLGGTMMSRSTSSKNAAAADAFIKFCTDTEPVTMACESLNTVPPLPAALKASTKLSENRLIKEGLDGLEYASFEGGSAAWMSIRGQIDPILEEALILKTEVPVVLEKVQKMAQDAIAQL